MKGELLFAVLLLLVINVNAGNQSHFAFMPADEAYDEAVNLGVFWSRPHPGPFIWGDIEQQEGTYDWTMVDEYVIEAQSYGFDLLATIWPFADWDQEDCHSYSECEGAGFEPEPEKDESGIPMWRCTPCNLSAYENFVRAMVERYDGDGVDDMPNLSRGIKHWEALNEPSMQEGDLIFFIGSSEEYLDILNSTYQAVKEAYPEANVLHAGMAGFSEDPESDEVRDFWSPIYSRAAEYFDIANIHSIGSGGEELWIPEMKEFMQGHNVNKTLWVTEVQYSAWGLGKESLTDEEWAETIVRSFVYALGNGADMLFYVALKGNPGEEGPELIERDTGTKKLAYTAFGTMVEQIDYFDCVEKNDNSTYVFMRGEGPVIVVWSPGEIPGNLTGNVTIADIYGNLTEMDSSEIELSESPIYILPEGMADNETADWDYCNLFGDYPPCDETVSDSELLDYIKRWIEGLVEGFKMTIAIDNWAGFG